MFDMLQAEYIFRVLLAGICGMIVGIERKNRSKEAGTRTHFVVACGAALIMVISKYAFFDVIQSGTYAGADVRLDPSRVASTIASGIGFLGAGMIFINKNTIKGLTTAAGIWATSGIGMAIGAGMYVLGVSTTFIILLAQLLLHLNLKKDKGVKFKTLIVKNVTEDGYQKFLTQEFEKKNICVHELTIERTEDKQKNYTFTIDIPPEIDEEDVITLARYESIIDSKE